MRPRNTGGGCTAHIQRCGAIANINCNGFMHCPTGVKDDNNHKDVFYEFNDIL